MKPHILFNGIAWCVRLPPRGVPMDEELLRKALHYCSKKNALLI